MKRSPLTRRTSLRSGSSLRRTRLAPMSQKRKRESRIYSEKRKAFLAKNPICGVWLDLWADEEWALMREIWNGMPPAYPPATECHHKARRTGKNYLDDTTWLAVSAPAHRWIETHADQARLRNWITT